MSLYIPGILLPEEEKYTTLVIDRRGYVYGSLTDAVLDKNRLAEAQQVLKHGDLVDRLPFLLSLNKGWWNIKTHLQMPDVWEGFYDKVFQHIQKEIEAAPVIIKKDYRPVNKGRSPNEIGDQF